jgi:bifunctional DNA-binding transcriptional regulator/antitoxin component of YhaV-PrlF toxin-antitoxin module
MKLQKRLGRIYKGKKYYKWVVVIPEDDVIDAGFKEGDVLKVKSDDEKIVLRKKD